MAKDRIIVAASFNHDAGTEHMAWQFIGDFASRHAIRLYAGNTQGMLFQQSAERCKRVVRLHRGRGAYWRQGLRLLAAMPGANALVVFNYQLGMSAALALNLIPAGWRPLSMLVHHLPIAWIRDAVELRRMSRHFPVFDMHVVPSHAMAEALLQTVPSLSRDKIRVIPNGIDITAMRAAAAACTVEADTWPSRRWRCVYVGSLRPDKRVDRLLRCFRQLPEASEVLLVLVGDGSEHKRLQKLAEELGVAGSCMFAGQQANPYAYIDGADLLVQASDWESFGLSLLEAMALGVPVLAMGDHSEGIRDVLEDGVQGRRIDSGDETEFARAWSQLLHDEPARRRMGEAGRHQAERFSLEAMLAEYRRLLEP